MKSFFVLLKNEIKVSIRDMNMVIFAIVMPLIILVVLGVVYGEKPAFAGAEYSFMELSFSATCAVSICAGGLMGLPLVISDYRERKILKRFRVTPASPGLLLGVELTVYILYCAVSILTLALVAGLFWHVRIQGSVPGFLLSWMLTMMSTLSIGLLVGGVAKNYKQAGVIASLLYFPMLVFSGTTLPTEVMPQAMQKVVGLFPLTRGISMMKHSFLGMETGSVLIPAAVMILVMLVCTGLAIRFFRWE